jgi:hypothetical protein
MAKARSYERGFSLVELLIALVFTMVLMAGMANVYKASIATFYTSGETLSNVRRNRMSVDLLSDDLNAACMYLTDLSTPPAVSAQVPPFFILPNMPIANAVAPDPATADELYFYVDQPLPFEGSLGAAAPNQTAAELVVAGTAPTVADNTFIINCADSPTYAQQVKKGQVFIFKDSWETGYITSDPTVSGSTVSVVAGAAPNVAVTGSGSAGLPSKVKHLSSSGIVFILPGQMVRYRIEILKLDPLNANGIPCLVRDQGTYNSAIFTPNQPQQVISENVSGFKAYLSANAGTSWAGLPLGVPATYTDFSAGWDLGIRTALDAQLAVSGRPDFKTTRGGEHWFRSIPTLVRVDISTRTATQRAEYSTTGNTLAYRNLTQSLVFVPRHSGLTMN